MIPVLGITGGYCSGKSTLASMLEDDGWVQIEVDRLGHQALEDVREELLARFGPDMAAADGSIDRRALGRLVFSDARALASLEAIVHPRMVEHTARLVDQYREAVPAVRGIIINAAILYHMKLHTLCDLVILVRAPLLTRIFRARKRDGLAWKDIFKRIRAQKTIHPQLVQQNVDIYTVDNLNSRRAYRRIRKILRAGIWNRTEST